AGGLGTAGLLVMHNSTIAFNDATEGGAGVFLQGTPAPSIVSSIVADNIAPGGAAYAADISGNTLNPIAGDHDLIVASDLPVPSGTIAADPLLAPLADNGGRTATHALPAASPAIDAGSNPDT